MPRLFIVDRNVWHFLWSIMVGLRAKVLGRLGRTENTPSKSVFSILPLARCLSGRGGVECVNPGPHLAAIASGGSIGTVLPQWQRRPLPRALRLPRRA